MKQPTDDAGDAGGGDSPTGGLQRLPQNINFHIKVNEERSNNKFGVVVVSFAVENH